MKIWSNQFIRGSFLLFIAGNFANFGNFLYNLAMGRMLSPAHYGELEVVLSLTVLFSIPFSLLSTYLVKITSTYWGQNKLSMARSFLANFHKKLFLIAVVGGLFILLFGSFLEKFLNFSSASSLVILSLLFFLTGISTVNNSGLQGVLFFGPLAFNSIAGTATKFFVSISLVFLNFQLFGALLGSVMGTLIGYLLSILELGNIFKNIKPVKNDTSPVIFKETFFPILLASLSLTLFLTLDVVLVRHFFSASISGEYAAVAVLGKIIYYAIGPVIAVMFPIISSRKSRGVSYFLPLFGSLIIVCGVGSLVSLIFFMSPQFIMNTLFAGKYLGGASYLGFYSLFMIFFSLNAVFTYFLISVSYFRYMGLLFCISLLPGILIFLFHNTISELIVINVSVSLVYFVVVSSLACRYTNFPLLFLRIVRQKLSFGTSVK